MTLQDWITLTIAIATVTVFLIAMFCASRGLYEARHNRLKKGLLWTAAFAVAMLAVWYLANLAFTRGIGLV